MRRSFYDFCNDNKRLDLLMQWDIDANLPLTPKSITSGSSRNIWWFCEKGHHWQQAPWVRTVHGSGCPVCAGKKIVSGDNDLQTLFPDIAEEWHSTKNIDLLPDQVSPYTHRKAWWKCSKCGHEWSAVVKSRTSGGSGCPVCAGKTAVPGVNDLASRCPTVADEWHPTKNGALTPQEVTIGTIRKVWWRCKVCDHEWQATISSRTHGSGCPVCAGRKVVAGVNDLASRSPDIAKEWDSEKNAPLMPDAVAPQSNRRVWWICEKGHSYQAVVANRTSARVGCPYCSGKRVLKGFNDLATLLPLVAAEWHPTKNGALTPEGVTCGSAKHVWWKCGACGHEWKAIIYFG